MSQGRMTIFSELKRRNVLRVAVAYVAAAWLILQVLELVFPPFGFGDSEIRTVILLMAIGLVPVLIFAWCFEITPEGLKWEKDVDRTQSITATTGKKLDRVIIATLTLALGYFAVDKFILSESREATIAAMAREEGRTEALVESFGDKSIAVLPFVNMSSDPEQEYFSDGISEELLNLLAKIPELRVISRSSSFTYKGKEKKLSEVARELNVGHILEGSVRKADNQVRITVQLIDARADLHLWSETYDRTLDNIFEIQDEISAAVVQQLKLKLFGEAPRAIETDPEAYRLFLQGRHLRLQNTPDSLNRSESLLLHALAIDPAFLPAMDELITVYINQAHTGQREFNEGYELARSLTENGLAIDPDSSRLLAQRAWVAMFYDRNFSAAAEDFERALLLNPGDAAIIGDCSTLMLILGRLDDAIAIGRYSIKLNPAHPVARMNLGNTLTYAGRYAEAVEQYRTGLSLSPDYGGGQLFLSLALLHLGKTEDALAELAKEKVDGYRLRGLAIVNHALGRSTDSNSALQYLIALGEADWAVSIAEVFAYRGETEAAFEWIDRAVSLGHSELLEMHVNPMFRHLHGDPRWQSVLVRLGQSDDQLAAIHFEANLQAID